MKKKLPFISSLLLVGTLFSCTMQSYNYQEGLIKEAIDAKTLVFDTASIKEREKEINDYMIPFSSKLTSSYLSSLETKDNSIISPLTAYFGISMSAEATGGDTRKEILSSLGFSDISSLRKATDDFFNMSIKENTKEGKIYSKERLYNSMWLDRDISFKEEALDNLSEYHHADSFAVSYKKENKKTNEMFNEYIYEKSEHLLNPGFKIDQSTLFLLASVLYVKDIWKFREDFPLSDENYDFVNYKGETTSTPLVQTHYYVTKTKHLEKYSVAPLHSQASYKLFFILPNENEDVFKIMSDKNTLKEIFSYSYDGEDRQNNREYLTRFYFPEFEVENKMSLKKSLRGLGISKIFSSECDMSPLIDGDAYFSDALQANKLRVNKTGFEGASVYVQQSYGAAEPPERIYEDLIINRSFGFVLADKNNIPLFSGVIANI